MTGEERALIATEVVAFTSLVRARLHGAFDDDHPAGQSPNEQMWAAVYGSQELTPGTVEDVVKQCGELMFRKLNIACLTAIYLSMELAKATGRPAIEHLDEVEKWIVDSLDETSD